MGKNRPNGAMEKLVEKLYSEKFKEKPPKDWIDQLENRYITITADFGDNMKCVKALPPDEIYRRPQNLSPESGIEEYTLDSEAESEYTDTSSSDNNEPIKEVEVRSNVDRQLPLPRRIVQYRAVLYSDLESEDTDIDDIPFIASRPSSENEYRQVTNSTDSVRLSVFQRLGGPIRSGSSPLPPPPPLVRPSYIKDTDWSSCDEERNVRVGKPTDYLVSGEIKPTRNDVRAPKNGGFYVTPPRRNLVTEKQQLCESVHQKRKDNGTFPLRPGCLTVNIRNTNTDNQVTTNAQSRLVRLPNLTKNNRDSFSSPVRTGGSAVRSNTQSPSQSKYVLDGVGDAQKKTIFQYPSSKTPNAETQQLVSSRAQSGPSYSYRKNQVDHSTANTRIPPNQSVSTQEIEDLLSTMKIEDTSNTLQPQTRQAAADHSDWTISDTKEDADIRVVVFCLACCYDMPGKRIKKKNQTCVSNQYISACLDCKSDLILELPTSVL